MQEYPHINEKINRLVFNLRKRYRGKTSLYIGIIALKAGQKLINNYYRTHKTDIKSLELITYIVEYLSEFQEILNKFKI